MGQVIEFKRKPIPERDGAEALNLIVSVYWRYWAVWFRLWLH